jgi:hypothetical protein
MTCGKRRTSRQNQQAVTLAAGETQSERIGTVSLTMMLEKPITLELKIVLYIPGINARLLSTKRLSKEHGIGVHLSPNRDYLTLRDNLIGHITQKKGQYEVKCMTGGEDASTALARYTNLKPPSKAQPLTVWHRRLCYLGIRNVVKLAHRAEGVIISRDRQDNSPAICEYLLMAKAISRSMLLSNFL